MSALTMPERRYECDTEAAKLLRQLILVEGGTGLDVAEVDKKLCVMQAVAFITGQAYTDHPVCVSEVITELMIELNDSGRTSDRQRNALKKVVPDLIGTAPIEVTTGLFGQEPYERQDRHNPLYERAESKRHEMVKDFVQQHLTKKQQRLASDGWRLTTFSELVVGLDRKLAFIKELADVQRWDNRKQPASVASGLAA